jgi:Acetyltransferase (GNAT) domain
MKASSCRYIIRKAERLPGGMEVRHNGAQDDDDFLSLYNRFARQKGHSGPMSLQELFRLRQLSDLWVARYEKRPLAAHLTLKDEETGWVIGLYYATIRFEGAQQAELSGLANRYLHWCAIQKYQSLGCECYDFGSIHQNRDEPEYGGLTSFKLSFGGDVIVQNRYYLASFIGRAGYQSIRRLPRLKAMFRGRMTTGRDPLPPRVRCPR